MKRAIYFACLSFSLFAASAKPSALFIVNVSASMPRGIYLATSVPPVLGDFVVIDSKRLPFSVTKGRLLKRLAYQGPAAYRTGRYGLSVGRDFFPKSRDAGLLLEGVMGRDECLILGDHYRSFDSRYFGPVKRADLTRVVPLVLFDGTPFFRI